MADRMKPLWVFNKKPKSRPTKDITSEHCTNNIEEINALRKELGLPLIVKGKKKCLGCDKEFESWDVKKVRYCNRCRNRIEQEGEFVDFSMME